MLIVIEAGSLDTTDLNFRGPVKVKQNFSLLAVVLVRTNVHGYLLKT